ARLGRRPRGHASVLGHALMDLGATVCTPRAPRCDACPLADCASRGMVAPPPRRVDGRRERFEDTDRYARGRVLAALAAGKPLPEELDSGRMQRVLTGLERDGLVFRDASGARLPYGSGPCRPTVTPSRSSISPSA